MSQNILKNSNVPKNMISKNHIFGYNIFIPFNIIARYEHPTSLLKLYKCRGQMSKVRLWKFSSPHFQFRDLKAPEITLERDLFKSKNLKYKLLKNFTLASFV